ncbi:MAG: hypothetical protein K0S70_12 [Microbacterium sp.]|jgi:hypothetical protein|nr:hypothetical protein [Microbacterium sp.]
MTTYYSRLAPTLVRHHPREPAPHSAPRDDRDTIARLLAGSRPAPVREPSSADFFRNP